jgi:hypothetical protein
MEREIQE